ncbi:MAG: 4Fe-4S binding protein [Chloroherpetonaceae bacterium]|nr:4Fe-4S binding protein [Chthonomonadaceae bacterium]MDW8208549.1 4Fe-4S binding protein [Chloroherpetonaceae bacterium]
MAAGSLVTRRAEATVWQIDPLKCIQCGRCATACVLTPSAVKCLHAHVSCGYCRLCFGLFRDQRSGNETTAENNRCPTDAIRRAFVEDPYFEMTIDEDLCIGCARCVKGCNAFGNGSLFLQIRQDLCARCNQCAIALACPVGAVERVPVSQPYRMKTEVRR